MTHHRKVEILLPGVSGTGLMLKRVHWLVKFLLSLRRIGKLFFKDGGVKWILLTIRDTLKRENDRGGAINHQFKAK
jgi:transposase